MASALETAGRVLLVGGGNMGGAMLRGWLEAGLDPAHVTVLDPNGAPLLRDVFSRGVRLAAAPAEVEASADTAVLAVKPQVMPTVLPSLLPLLSDETLIVSVAAGRTVASIEAALGERAVVRAMPNTPALVNRGITGAYANARVSAEMRARAQALLESSGPVEWVEREALIDAVTGVSGSGPAYVFLLAEALAEAGVAAGLEPALAMRLARHTVAGAGELMIRSGDEPAQLRRNVTSPNGTTQAALAILMADDGFAPLLRRAVLAARDRAEELSRG
ncbi:pyrroline-5-carboxylate reductase [Aureimonas sp. AU4]|uniref:pyrroline-5-carboxylate reductase n=1 Tax=Aureimonas sp. AU4 TaxID=1638163 RepID=UPI0007827537|nr:pyrroline-5-carboxylate reductase [Aureimonas sp. AU4]